MHNCLARCPHYHSVSLFTFVTGDTVQLGQPCHASHLARLPIPATVQTQTLAVIVTGQMRLLILGLFILTVPTIFGQTKQGYIDYERVVVTFPQYFVGQKEVEKRTDQLTDSLRTIGDKITDLVRGEYPRNLTSDSSFRKELENKLLTIQIEMDDFQSNAKEQLKKLQNRIDNNLLELVSSELKKFSTDNHLICVLDKKSILYCNDCKDFTDDFIAYLKSTRK